MIRTLYSWKRYSWSLDSFSHIRWRTARASRSVLRMERALGSRIRLSRIHESGMLKLFL